MSPELHEAVIVLGATAVVIPLFHRLKVSPIIGYMLVGVVVGPYGLGRFVEQGVKWAHLDIAGPA